MSAARAGTKLLAAALLAVAAALIVLLRVWPSPPAPAPSLQSPGAARGGAAEPPGAAAEGLSPPASPSASPPAPQPVPPAAMPAPPPQPGPASKMTEPALMMQLHHLGQSAPQQTLELAREGQRRFGDTADGAERAYIIIRSLVDLRRFHEARDEAKLMLQKYPDNPQALDAQRHLLVYPLDQPSREEMQAQMKRDQQRDQ